MADLSARDIEKAKFAFSIYDFQGNDTMDAFYLGDCLRALNLNPTIAVCEKLGMEKMKKTKMMKLDEFLPIYSQVKKDKDCGSFEAFMEDLKLYDELEHILVSLGERMEKEEVIPVLAETCPEEDEDGFIAFEPFCRKLTEPSK